MPLITGAWHTLWNLSQAAKIADALTRDVHYTVDEKQKSVLLTEDGYEAVEDVLQVGAGAC
jgi:preprotein translocase subunit SecA